MIKIVQTVLETMSNKINGYGSNKNLQGYRLLVKTIIREYIICISGYELSIKEKAQS